MLFAVFYRLMLFAWKEDHR